MFWKKDKMSIDSRRLSSLLAADTCVRGDVIFDGGLRVDGRVEGNVVGKPGAQGLLVLSDKGTVVGGVMVHDAVINGCVEGDIEVEHFLELQANARVTGNISYRTLKLECGANVEGKLERMDGAAEAGEEVEVPKSKVLTFAKAP